MRDIAFKVFALALALGVAVFIVSASCTRARETGPQATREPAASASAPAPLSASPNAAPAAAGNDAGVTGRRLDDEDLRGIMGPSTKADPHAIRRAVESIAPSASASAAPR